MRYSILLLSILFLSSCSQSPPRRSVNKAMNTRDNFSVKLNQALNAIESQIIYEYIDKDSLTYQQSSYGFFYAIKDVHQQNRQPVEGDTIQFIRRTYRLNNQLLYDYNDRGIETYIVDKMPLMKGLQVGVKLVRENEEIKFIFPSFVAHGFKGDDKKIHPSEPIIVNIKLLKIK